MQRILSQSSSCRMRRTPTPFSPSWQLQNPHHLFDLKSDRTGKQWMAALIQLIGFHFYWFHACCFLHVFYRRKVSRKDNRNNLRISPLNCRHWWCYNFGTLRILIQLWYCRSSKFFVYWHGLRTHCLLWYAGWLFTVVGYVVLIENSLVVYSYAVRYFSGVSYG